MVVIIDVFPEPKPPCMMIGPCLVVVDIIFRILVTASIRGFGGLSLIRSLQCAMWTIASFSTSCIVLFLAFNSGLCSMLVFIILCIFDMTASWNMVKYISCSGCSPSIPPGFHSTL
jgi:hypothetical protein